ncbi:MAG: DNA-directed RNA polymerase subunit beta' [Clostridia bacterium]|nr:DNA-directed RNA polymerase subunit beta' [Clostridia bacterium]
MELNNFDSIQIGIASPEKIREWSYGEVTKPETINYRTQKPEKDGLFCERIFGPVKDWECHCGKYKRIRYKGVICDKCGVKVTKSKVRRERMGHIELAAPVSHIWYFRGVPSRMGLLLDMSPKHLEQVLNFAYYVVLDPKDTDLTKKQVLIPNEYKEQLEKYGPNGFRVGMGAESIKELLQEIDLEKESKELKAILRTASGQKRARAIKRIEIVEAFRKSGNKPEWMILDVLPVLPPEIRPMVPLDGGRYATSDLNDLYRRVINRNNRLKKLIEINAPQILIRNEKRMLQEAVDSLIDNSRSKRPQTGAGNREFKSLSGMLRGKQGRFRQNLLGKRVDYSGRSVIVVGPELKLHQCGLPKEMALELFKPFVMRTLVDTNQCQNIKSAKRRVERADSKVWDVLEDVIKDHPVMLNRAPTLHKLSIQAFEPVLIEGRAIKLHPLACTAFNADFDGDQMAVHVPLSIEAQTEARFLMLASNNILKLSDGKPVVSPTQDMVMGCYYLTIDKQTVYGDAMTFTNIADAMVVYNAGEHRLQSKVNVGVINDDGTEIGSKNFKSMTVANESIASSADTCNKKVIIRPIVEDGAKGEGKSFSSVDEAILAYNAGDIELQSIVNIRVTKEIDGEIISGRIKTTVGRMIFNQSIPQDLGFCKRETKEDYLKNELEQLVDKKKLSQIVERCYKIHGTSQTAELLDRIKALGYKYSTVAGITASVFDMHIPPEKKDILSRADDKVLNVEGMYQDGLVTDQERYKLIVETWRKATDDVETGLKKTLTKFNPVWMMANSGARGTISQIRQISGMRGLMSDPSGKTIELPVKACFREGLTVLEYFISSHGSRKGLADTAIKTADSGYLTRRLVDVSHDVIVREEDCATGGRPQGMWISALTVSNNENEVIEKLEDRIIGRFSIDDVISPETGEILVHADSMITDIQAAQIVSAGIKKVYCRTTLTCRSRHGVCIKCYGKNMAGNDPVPLGEAVGVIAAQSIGEPGTQLTMRTFHTGGVATSEDITQGLPRVEELFEARKPKGVAVICENNGTVEIIEKENKRTVVVQEGEISKSYDIPFTARLRIQNGDHITSGTLITEGPVYPHDLLKTKGLNAVQEYLLKEVQSVYMQQGVTINDKHVEIIVRQMLRKVKIEDAGDTKLLPGELVDIFHFEEENTTTLENGGKPATAKRALLGITKASLATESFLSAASFQETSRVLTEAAIKNKVDPLIGLKENVIIGKLLTAGTGLKNYRGYNVKQVINSIPESSDQTDFDDIQ